MMDLTFFNCTKQGGYKKRNQIIYYAPCTKETCQIKSAGGKRFSARSL